MERRVLRVHVHDEVGVLCKERHLTFRFSTVGAVCVGLDELSDGEAVSGLCGREGLCLLIRGSPPSGPRG